MKKFYITLFLILSFASIVHSSQSTITTGEGYSCIGDDKTRKQTEQNALIEAKRNAVEKTVTYLRSETTVKNFQFEKDVVEAYSNATVKTVDELEKGWYKDLSMGDCYRIKIKAEVMPDEIMTDKLTSQAASDDPTAPLKVKVWTDKKEYKECDKVKVFIKGNKPFFARVIYKDAGGNLVQLLPNRFRENNYFDGNVVYEIPSGLDKFDLAVSPPYGNEQISIYAATGELGDINLSESNGVYTVKTKEKDIGIRSRGIKITEKTGAAPAAEFYEGKTTITTGGKCGKPSQSLQNDLKPAEKMEMVAQTGSTAYGRTLLFSPDGEYLVIGYFGYDAFNSTIKLWRTSTGMLLRTFIVHSAQMSSVALSPDGQTIAYGTRSLTSNTYKNDGEIGLLRVSDFKVLKKISVGRTVSSVAFGPDGKYIASATRISEDRFNIEMRSVTDGALIQTIENKTEPQGCIYRIVFSPDGKYIASGDEASGYTGTIKLWRVSDGSLVRVVGKFNTEIKNEIAFSPDGKLIAGGVAEINLWQVSDGLLLRSFAGDIGPGNSQNAVKEIKSISFSPDGQFILSGSNHRYSARIWRVSDGALVKSLLPEKIITKVAFSPNGKYIAVSGLGKDGGVGIIQVSDYAVIQKLATAASPSSDIKIAANLNDKIIVGDPMSLFTVWRMSNPSLIDFNIPKYINNMSRAGRLGIVSPDGNYFAADVTDLDNRQNHYIKLWRVSDGALIRTFGSYLPDRLITRLEFSQDGKFIVSVDAKDSWANIKIWRVSDGSLIRQTDSAVYVNSLSFSPDGTSILSCSTPDRSKSVSILSITKESMDREYGGYFCYFATFSRDSKKIAVWTDDKDMPVKVIQVSDGAVVKSFRGAPQSIALSPDGVIIAIADFDNSIKLWRVSDGSLVRAFAAAGNIAKSLTFSGDGRHLVYANDNGTHILNISSGDIVSLFELNGEWLMFTPDGYFDSSKHGGSLVAMVKGMEAFGVDQFAIRNNRPDIILKRMGLGSQELIDHYYSQFLKRLRRSGFTEEQLNSDLHVPEAEVTDTKLSGKFAEIGFKLSDNKYNLKRYNIYVNDIPLFGAYGKEIRSHDIVLKEKIELATGKNKIEVAAINEKGAESYRALTFAEYKDNVNGDLYFIGFGVSRYKDGKLNLKYADKDATDLAAAYSKMKGKPYNNVFIKTYLNEDVTSENVENAKELLRNAKVDDTVVLFIAGHGVHDTDKEATYYYLTHNSDINNLSNTAVNFDYIEDLMQGISPRNKLFLMDTCESGEVDEDIQNKLITLADSRGIRARAIRGIEVKPKTKGTPVSAEPLKKKREYLLERDRYIYNDLSRRSGAIVFSSSKGSEFSYESDNIQNGFFTKEILAALTQKEADKNNDEIVSMDELREYVGKMVSEKTGGLQHPTVDRDNLYQRFGFEMIK